jgi:hypothetical protein
MKTEIMDNMWVVTIIGGIIVVLVTYYFFGIGKNDQSNISNSSSQNQSGGITATNVSTTDNSSSVSNSTGVFFVGSTLNNSPVTINQVSTLPEVPKTSSSSIDDKNRAFLSVVPQKISKNIIRPDLSDYLIEYDVLNSGITPADQVHITLLFVSNDKVIGTAINEVYSRIGANRWTNNRDVIDNEWLKLMKFGTNNYLQIVVQYYDYNGKSHKYVMEIQVEPGSTDPLNSKLVTKREFEE